MRFACLVVAAQGAFGLPAMAQAVSPEVGAGIAIPVGRVGTYRSPGPLVRGGVILGAPERRVRLSLGVEGSWFPGEREPEPDNRHGDLRILGLLATLVIGEPGRSHGLYAALGLGLHKMTVQDHPWDPGIVGGLRGGLGLRFPVRGRPLRAELTPHVMLSDYATAKEYSPATYFPFSLSLSF